MDFFKSVFSDPEPDPEPSLSTTASSSSSSTPSINTGSGGWGFGGLIKTITTKSESVLETYKRDLAEFSSGLKRETEVLREVASRAAHELPSSAQSVVSHSLADLVSHSKDAILAATAQISESDNHSESEPGSASTNAGRRYNRFETQLLSIQSDPNSFTSDPEEREEYERWREEFRVEDKEEEIEALCYDSDVLERMVERLVPETVEYGTFWCRYFYRVERLKKAEDARAKLVKRVMEREEEEEDLTWEVDDDDDDAQEKNGEEIGNNEVQVKVEEEREKKIANIQDNVEQESETKQEEREKKIANIQDNVEQESETKQEGITTESKVEKDVDGVMVSISEEDSLVMVVDEEETPMPVHEVETLGLENEELSKEEPLENDGKQNGESLKSEAEDAVVVVEEGGKRESGQSSKDGDYTLVSSQPPVLEEEDLEWDEIEDLGEHDDKKLTTGASSSPALKEDFRKRLSTAEDEEDLNWDIEEDDDDGDAGKH